MSPRFARMDLQDRLPWYSIRTWEIPLNRSVAPAPTCPPSFEKIEEKDPEIKMENEFHMIRGRARGGESWLNSTYWSSWPWLCFTLSSLDWTQGETVLSSIYFGSFIVILSFLQRQSTLSHLFHLCFRDNLHCFRQISIFSPFFFLAVTGSLAFLSLPVDNSL